MDIASILLFAVVFIASFAALHFWRRAKHLGLVLRNGAEQYEQQRQRLAHLESKAAQTEELRKTLKEQEKDTVKKLKNLQQKNAELETLNETKQSEFQAKLRNIELQRDHVIKQLEASTDRMMLLQQQLSESLEQKTQAEVDLAKLRRDAKGDTMDQLKAQLYKVEQALQVKTSELKNAEMQLTELSGEKLEQLKRRAAHYERLYASMRSLREMSEERLENWETALRKLAVWTLQKQTQQIPSTQEPIGELVGAALEAIGTTLIDPRDDFAPAQPENRHDHVAPT